MNSLEFLSFNYNKSVNNLPNKGNAFNNLLLKMHKMEHTRYVSLCKSFYNKNEQMLVQTAESDMFYALTDLEMYCIWLGNNGVKRNKKR